MTKKERKYRSNEEKVAIIREHLLEGVAISEVCQKHGIPPSLYYKWQKELFENGSLAFGPKGTKKESPAASEEKKLKRKVDQLEAKLRQREEVVSELMTDHLALKKRLGEP